MHVGANPQRPDHCGVWVEFFLRYHLSETSIASESRTSNTNTFERYEGIGVNVHSIIPGVGK